MSIPNLTLDIDTLSSMAPLRPVVFSLGSNLGDSLETLQGAVNTLAVTPGLELTGVSSVYRTAPVGGPAQDDFLNLVVTGFATLTTAILLERAQAIEQAFGRTRAQHWGPRTLDIDLIAVGDRRVERTDLTLPHPRAHERAFVLVPWLEVDPDAELPGHGRVADLVAALSTEGVERVTDQAVDLP